MIIHSVAAYTRQKHAKIFLSLSFNEIKFISFALMTMQDHAMIQALLSHVISQICLYMLKSTEASFCSCCCDRYGQLY